MKILGVDPGMARTGYGVIESDGKTLQVLTCGCIITDAKQHFSQRLKIIYDELSLLVTTFAPDEFAIEDVFISKNAKLALTIGHARGVALLMAVNHSLPAHEYSVREVKQAVAGNGAASKQQVQRMVMHILSLSVEPKYYDITDALAVAVCHLHRSMGKIN